MTMDKDSIIVGGAAVLAVILFVICGFVGGWVLTWFCGVIDYGVNDDILRTVWIALYFGVGTPILASHEKKEYSIE